MKLGLFLIAFICGFPFSKCAEQDLCETAAQLYHQGAYQKAYDVYDALELKTSDIWYNMGNCCYKNNDTIQALLCWERAIELDPSKENRDCYTNISFTSGKAGIVYDMNSSWLETIVKYVYYWVWQVLFLLVWYVFFWSFMTQKNRWYTMGLFSISFALGYVVTKAYAFQTTKLARVTNREAYLLAGPNENFHSIGSLDYLARLDVLDTKGSWYKVRNGSVHGWVAMDTVEVV